AGPRAAASGGAPGPLDRSPPPQTSRQSRWTSPPDANTTGGPPLPLSWWLVADPYQVRIRTSELTGLAAALDVVAEHAELNHRYHKLIDDSRRALAAEEVRLTQARGIAKRLMVLVKAAGPNFADTLPEQSRQALNDGLMRAHGLVLHSEAAAWRCRGPCSGPWPAQPGPTGQHAGSWPKNGTGPVISPVRSRSKCRVKDSNLRRQCRLIYSQLPLATRATRRSKRSLRLRGYIPPSTGIQRGWTGSVSAQDELPPTPGGSTWRPRRLTW